MRRSKSPRDSIALPSLRLGAAGVREIGFSKRCVVASELRGVASEYGQSPKRVLTKAFHKCRRAAWTDKSMRMSWRLAQFQSRVQAQSCVQAKFCVQERVMFKSVSEVSVASVKLSAWRPLSVCVASVLRDVRVAKSAVVERPAVAKLN